MTVHKPEQGLTTAAQDAEKSPGSRILNFVEKRREAIQLCWDHQYDDAAYILLYACIDSLAWLGLPRNNPDVSRTHFEEWVNKYLLAHAPRLTCTATELYAARCGLVHCNSTGSNLYRGGKARQVFYGANATDAHKLAGVLGEYQKATIIAGDFTVIDRSELLGALVAGAEVFAREVDADTSRQQQVAERLDNQLASVSREEIDAIALSNTRKRYVVCARLLRTGKEVPMYWTDDPSGEPMLSILKADRQFSAAWVMDRAGTVKL